MVRSLLRAQAGPGSRLQPCPFSALREQMGTAPARGLPPTPTQTHWQPGAQDSGQKGRNDGSESPVGGEGAELGGLLPWQMS